MYNLRIIRVYQYCDQIVKGESVDLERVICVRLNCVWDHTRSRPTLSVGNLVQI